jgi:hypothetical protein
VSSIGHPKGRRRQRKPPEPPLILFTDRSLGRIQVPLGIRALGYTVFTIWDVFPQELDDRSVSDPQWLWHSARRGWVCLTFDELRKPPSVPRELVASGARVFRYENALGTAPLQIAAFEANQHRIRRWATKAGPYRRVIRRDGTDPDGIP